MLWNVKSQRPEQGVGVAKGQRRDARVGAHLRFVVERSELERVQSFVRFDGSDA